MFRVVFDETKKKIWRNRKNRLLIILSIISIFIYTLIIMPGQSHPTEASQSQFNLQMNTEMNMKEERLSDGNIGITRMSGVDSYLYSKQRFETYDTYAQALQDGNAKLLVDNIATVWPNHLRNNLDEYVYDRAGLDFNAIVYERSTFTRNMAFIALHNNISMHTVQEKTSIQQFYLFFKSYGPLIIFLITIFIASEILVEDRKHRTLKAGPPISWWKYIFYQSVSTYVIVAIFIAAALTAFFIINGLLYGTGPADLLVNHYVYQSEGGLSSFRGDPSHFDSQYAWTFVWKSIGLVLMIMFLLIRLNALFSLIFRHEILVMVIGFAVVLLTIIYGTDGSGEFFGLPGYFLPQNYFEVGSVISGERNYFATTDMYNFVTGSLVIFSSIVIVEILLYIATLWMNRQKFEREVR